MTTEAPTERVRPIYETPKDRLAKRVRLLYETLYGVSEQAADEAVEQAKLPPVFCWSSLSVRNLEILGIACRIRLLEAGVSP